MSQIKLEELLNSKVYVKENSSVRFTSAKQYVEPFLEALGQDVKDVRVSVSSPVMNAEESGKMNIAYPRVNVETTIGGGLEGFTSVVGMIFALNTQIPIAKVYTGQSVSVCMNLCIFNSDDLFEKNLLGDFNELYLRTATFKANKMKQIEEYGKVYKDMTENMLTPMELNTLMGDLLLKGTTSKLGSSPIVGAAKLLKDNKTTYYVNEGPDFSCNKWNVLNAVTQVLGDGDPILRPDKTIQIAKLLEVA